MTDSTPVVRWRRIGPKGQYGTHRYVRWHRIVGRQTACGLDIPWQTAEIGAAGDGELCANCTRGLGGETDHTTERTAA